MLQEYFGINDENLGKAALGFGGGCATRQSECGALVGGVMALGVKHGKPVALPPEEDAMAQRAKIREEASKLVDSFAQTFGHTYCRQLTGYDFRQPEGLKGYRADQEARLRCLSYVGFVVRQLTAD